MALLMRGYRIKPWWALLMKKALVVRCFIEAALEYS
jgi:hypothetical protein